MKTISFLALIAPASAAVYRPGRLVSNANPSWWRNTNLRECQGDCDADRNCARGLKCWQRNYYDAVPGCTGRGGRHWDYCYDPQKKATREAMTRDYTHLANFGATPIGTNLGKCVGDCDLDGHCKRGLKCFHRNGNEKIPGCKGTATKGYDFCYNPADLLKEQMAKDHSSLKDYGWTPIGNTLGKCVGDCDHNGHCRGGLKCWHRDANERVPGCSGRAVSILDYCYDPKDLAANHNTLVNYGWTPSGAPMGACAGDCDHNGHCTGSLVCQQRNNYEKVSGCRGKSEYGVDYCVKPTKNPTKSPTKKPTAHPTAHPTASPTLSPTERCDANNCMNWSCLDWCECYDESDLATYENHAECQDDNDDTCICFDKEEHELNGERHRKINYNQDAVDAGTAEKIEGTEIHTATKQNHYQEAPKKAKYHKVGNFECQHDHLGPEKWIYVGLTTHNGGFPQSKVNPGTTREGRIGACAKVCSESDPKYLGFVMYMKPGSPYQYSCICEYQNSATCVKSGQHDGPNMGYERWDL